MCSVIDVVLFGARESRLQFGDSRRELFDQVVKAALRPLPARAFEYADWSKVKVNLDYHVEVDHHWYSAPHALVGERLEARFTATTVELFTRGRRVASHARSYERHRHTTDPAHRPPNHQAWADTDPGGLIAWAATAGPCVEAMMKRILESNIHREQTWRSGRALRRVVEKYGVERGQVACERALAFGARSFKPVETMLKHELDRRAAPDASASGPSIEHEHVRGPDYYIH